MRTTAVIRHAKTMVGGFCLTVVLLVVAFTIVIPKVIGGASLTVLTGSMEPTIPAGSIVLVQPVDAEAVRAGDVITFQARPDTTALVTHRVVGVNFEDERRSFTTKGDANEGNDTRPVPESAVRGRVVFDVPYLGKLSDVMRTEQGLLLFVVVPGLLYAAAEARERYGRKRSVVVEPPAVEAPAVAAAAEGSVSRELLVARVTAGLSGRREVILLAKAFEGSLIGVAHDAVAVSLTGSSAILDEFELLLATWPQRVVERSGPVTVPWEHDGDDEVVTVEPVQPIDLGVYRSRGAESVRADRLREVAARMRAIDGAQAGV
jgi:signal peptidase